MQDDLEIWPQYAFRLISEAGGNEVCHREHVELFLDTPL